MKKTGFAIMLCLLVAAAGCGAGSDAVSKVAAVEKQACACTDRACADEALVEFKRVFEEVRHEKVSKENSQKLKESAEQITRCLLKQGVPANKIREQIK